MNILLAISEVTVSKNKYFAPGISSLLLLCMYLILVFLFLHYVCFVKQGLDVYAILQGRTEIRNCCLCHLNNLPHVIDMEKMLCINKKRQFVLSQQRGGGREQ